MLYKRSQIWLCTLFSPLSWPLDCAIARALKELVGSSYKSLTATMFPNSMSLFDKFEIPKLSKEAMFQTISL